MDISPISLKWPENICCFMITRKTRDLARQLWSDVQKYELATSNFWAALMVSSVSFSWVVTRKSCHKKTQAFIDLCSRYQAHYHSVRVWMWAAAIRLHSLFIIPSCAPSLASPLTVLEASEAVGLPTQDCKILLHVQYEQKIREVDSFETLHQYYLVHFKLTSPLLCLFSQVWF